jgi:two-component system, response regulator, stage 0 sporulation protein F
MPHLTPDRSPRTRQRPRASGDQVADVWPPCVHLAEADDPLREEIAQALRRDRYEVVEARSGAELLEQVRASMLPGAPHARPDVIVVAAQMPGTSGLEILELLPALALDAAVVLMTREGGELPLARARALGARAVFMKPFDLDDLRTVVLNLMPEEALLRNDWFH